MSTPTVVSAQKHHPYEFLVFREDANKDAERFVEYLQAKLLTAANANIRDQAVLTEVLRKIAEIKPGSSITDLAFTAHRAGFNLSSLLPNDTNDTDLGVADVLHITEA